RGTTTPRDVPETRRRSGEQLAVAGLARVGVVLLPPRLLALLARRPGEGERPGLLLRGLRLRLLLRLLRRRPLLEEPELVMVEDPHRFHHVRRRHAAVADQE